MVPQQRLKLQVALRLHGPRAGAEVRLAVERLWSRAMCWAGPRESELSSRHQTGGVHGAAPEPVQLRLPSTPSRGGETDAQECAEARERLRCTYMRACIRVLGAAFLSCALWRHASCAMCRCTQAWRAGCMAVWARRCELVLGRGARGGGGVLDSRVTCKRVTCPFPYQSVRRSALGITDGSAGGCAGAGVL